MPRGIPELKRRNSASRARYHANRQFGEYLKFRAENEKALWNLYREDLATGEVTVSNRSVLNREVGVMFSTTVSTNPHLAPYATPATIVWEQLELGATYFGEKAVYWLEKVMPAH